jgi:hypothetical protein
MDTWGRFAVSTFHVGNQPLQILGDEERKKRYDLQYGQRFRYIHVHRISDLELSAIQQKIVDIFQEA